MLQSYRLYNLDSQRKELLSATLTFIKFPLACLVVLLHADPSSKRLDAIGFDIETVSSAAASVIWFFSQYLGHIAVPAFYIISGFLFFYGVKTFDKATYQQKLQRRAKSLLVPYLAWNVIFLIAIAVIGQTNIPFLQFPPLLDGSISPVQFIVAVFVKPLDGPLWFIRDLMVMVVATPLLYQIIKRTGYLLPLLLYVSGFIWHNPHVESLMWFALGNAFAICDFDFLQFCRKYLFVLLPLALGVPLLDLFFYPELGVHLNAAYPVVNILSQSKFFAMLGLGYWAVEHLNGSRGSRIFNDSTFVIYACHDLPQMLLLSYGLTFVKDANVSLTGGVIIVWILAIILIITIGVLISRYLIRSSKVREILCGR